MEESESAGEEYPSYGGIDVVEAESPNDEADDRETGASSSWGWGAPARTPGCRGAACAAHTRGAVDRRWAR